jgi:N-acetylglucosaminyldiphosphoundecaprenol N-acetyl-beta-D-mannosaminyltransferase
VKSLSILDCRLDYFETPQIHDLIQKTIREKNKIRISNLNIYACNLAYEHKWYQNYVNESACVLCDGKGVQLASWFLGKKPPRQITYHTWSWSLLEFCQENKISVYFLGSEKETLEEAVRRVKSRFPRLKLGGHDGFFKKEGPENKKVIQEINRFRPNILVVGFGMPLQEKWIKANQKSIDANIFANAGAFLDWISGRKRTAPVFIIRLGLEWLYRLVLEPKRLFRRYVYGNPLFFIRLIGHHYLGLKRKTV